MCMCMSRPRKFCKRGSNVFLSLFLFLLDEGEIAFRWRADVGPTLNAGLVHL